jgi:pyruvate,water dikinase
VGDRVLYALQARPITTRPKDDGDDERSWYLTLTRSFENLRSLRQRIENELIPAMIEETDALAARNVGDLSDACLAAEIDRRAAILQKWTDAYWADFIPFAHGARLFGQVYNDTVRPDDPFEFMKLLEATQMKSLARNRALEELASLVRADSALLDRLRSGGSRGGGELFGRALKAFVERFGDASWGEVACFADQDALIRLILQIVEHPAAPSQRPSKDKASMEKHFLAHVDPAQRAQAAELLDLARTSYRLRDDDNIHLGRIQAHLAAAVDEARRRIGSANALVPVLEKAVQRFEPTPDSKEAHAKSQPEVSSLSGLKARPRQLIGQPAGAGIAAGEARVVKSPKELFEFQAGEVLVCDAIDPNMTFVVPLAAGVVERRGGMLIHGAIIAREYGLPCVTGVPDATALIRTGDHLSVDGFLGIVTVTGSVLRRG